MKAMDVITQSAAAAGFAKVLVEVVKIALPRIPRNYLPLFALGLSEACAFLLVGMDETIMFNRPVIFAVILMGIGATAGAIAITEVQTKGDKVNERIDAARTMPADSSLIAINAKATESSEPKP